jgi:hypothetical protein
MRCTATANHTSPPTVTSSANDVSSRSGMLHQSRTATFCHSFHIAEPNRKWYTKHQLKHWVLGPPKGPNTSEGGDGPPRGWTLVSARRCPHATRYTKQ